FEAAKVRAEQLIPLSAKAAAAIRAQQEHVLRHWPAGSPWLFPGITGNDDGAKAYSHRTFAQQLARWQRVIDLRDQAGQPVTVTGHQFRRTLGTRLINSGVPQHVIQKLPGHASPHMTACRYASTTPPSARRSMTTSASGSTSPARPSATTRTRPPRPPSGSSTTCPGSGTACPTATAAGRPSKTARTPTPA